MNKDELEMGSDKQSSKQYERREGHGRSRCLYPKFSGCADGKMWATESKRALELEGSEAPTELREA